MNRIKTIALVAALAGSTAAFSAVIPEGSYPQVYNTPTAQMVSRDTVSAEAGRWNVSGRPGQIAGEQRPDFVQDFGKSAVSRSEVASERDAWKGAGLADLVRGPTPDFGGADYQSRLNRYEAMSGHGTAAD